MRYFCYCYSVLIEPLPSLSSALRLSVSLKEHVRRKETVRAVKVAIKLHKRHPWRWESTGAVVPGEKYILSQSLEDSGEGQVLGGRVTAAGTQRDATPRHWLSKSLCACFGLDIWGPPGFQGLELPTDLNQFDHLQILGSFCKGMLAT